MARSACLLPRSQHNHCIALPMTHKPPVRRILGPRPGITWHAARCSPKYPFIEPAEYIGPSPPFDFALLSGDIEEHLVPAMVLKGHSGAIIDRLEANLYLSIVVSMSGVPI